MNSRDLSRFMWSEALSLLDQADRLHRQFARPAAARVPTWEPPVDVVETAGSLRMTVALPGVSPDSIAVRREADAITINVIADVIIIGFILIVLSFGTFPILSFMTDILTMGWGNHHPQ